VTVSKKWNSPNLSEMSEEDRNEYFAEFRRLMQDGYHQPELQAHFNLSKGAVKRHQMQVYRHFESEIAGTVKERASNDPHPHSAYFRQVPVTLNGTITVPLKGGRLTTLTGTQTKLGTILPPPESGEWRLEDVDTATLRAMTPAELIPNLIRASPEMSRALYDYLRMANPGWSLKAVVPGTDIPDPNAQLWCDFFITTLNNRPGKNAETIFNTLLSGMYIRGMLFCEMVLSPSDSRTLVDIVTPDPYSVRFRTAVDPLTGGQGYDMVQGTGRDAVLLDRPTIKVVSIDPLPGTPYGTSPLAPGLFPCLFIVTMLQDARRVVAQQGWPRLDIIVEVAEIMDAMPVNEKNDPEKVQAWVQQAVDDIANSYSSLDPDEAWVHSSTVKFGDPIGAIGSLEGIGPLFDILERMAVRALKSMPLLFGMPEGVSEANANRQWEVHVASIKAMQTIAENTLSSLFSLALEANGVAAQAKFKFEEMRLIEELREAQGRFQKLENAQLAELLGYMGHDEASMYAVGHPAEVSTEIGIVGDTAGAFNTPGPVGAGDTGDEKPIQGNDGAKRMRMLARVLGNPTTAMGVAYGMALLDGRIGDAPFRRNRLALSSGIRGNEPDGNDQSRAGGEAENETGVSVRVLVSGDDEDTAGERDN
jgi:hypothetical protein